MLTLAGCAHIDSFDGQMTDFNNAAERAQDQSIMLNVLRAADYRPLSFVELQSVSSSISPAANLTLAAPVAGNGGMTPTMLSPSLGFSGGPTIQAAYINTQDFYRGIVNPIPITAIDLLIQRRIPSSLLFNLLFSRIIVRQIANNETDEAGKLAGPGEVFTAINDPGFTGDKLPAFQDLVEALVNEGLTTGPGASSDTAVGPPLTEVDLGGADLIAKAVGAGLKLESADWCGLSQSEGKSLQRRRWFDFARVQAGIAGDCKTVAAANRRPEESGDMIDAVRKDIDDKLAAADAPLVYRLIKPGSSDSPRFCIAAPRSADGKTNVHPGICQIDVISTPSADNNGYRVRIAGGGQSNKRRLCDALNAVAKSGRDLACDKDDWIGNGLEVDLEPRSTYSVLYYLGQIERQERQSGPKLFVKVGDSLAAIPEGRCVAPDQHLSADLEGYRCTPLFYLRRPPTGAREYLEVVYDGVRYAPPHREVDAGKTNEVLDIVNELIALNRSAKDAPASSLLTVVGVH